MPRLTPRDAPVPLREVLYPGGLVPVFYDARMVATGQSSPSAHKPLEVVRSWEKQFPIQIQPVTPATRDQLCLAHSAAYVDAVLSCRRSNGFGSRDPDVARSLPYTTGSLLSAARHVLAGHSRIAVSPTSGFHHASYDCGGGYCTFNGLLVTALALQREGAVRRVAIIDCDNHYGDGTDDILSELCPVGIEHFTAGSQFHSPEQVPVFLDTLRDVCRAANDCDLVLYQAGADPHIDDPLGGWLTTEQMLERDSVVFGTVTSPLVWNLAGGYQREPDGSIPKVLALHDNTMRACLQSLRGPLFAPERRLQ